MKDRKVLKAVIADMLLNQSKLNRIAIGEVWWERPDCDFFLAVQQEAAEGIDHLGWKWWAATKASVPDAQMEVVDILHFVLSAELRNYLNADGPSPEDLIENLIFEYFERFTGITVDARSFDPANMAPIPLFQLISTLAGLNHNAFGVTCLLAEKLGLNFMALSTLYRAKITLNIFRQEHGYKTGDYKKIWRKLEGSGMVIGVEDNTVMQKELLDGIDWTAETATEVLKTRLEERYIQVLKTHYA